MKISKRKRPLILILIILFPTILMITTFNLDVQAGPAIPEPDPNNGWHWDVNVGDQLYYETEFIITNASTGEVSGMWKDIWIYNITSIEDVRIDWLGMHNFSLVNATQCYYNITAGEIEPYYEPQEFALFGYNSTDPITHRLRAGQMGMPLLLPKNSSSLEVDILAPIIKETFYDPMGNMAYNVFDSYSYGITSNRIYFENTTDGFYSDGYYYDNGTLDHGEAYLEVYMGSDTVQINATMKQVSNYDITDEVEWGVNIGDEMFYDSIDNVLTIDDANDIKLKITDISDILLNKSNNGFMDEELIQMVFQCVYADMFMWNGTVYEFMHNTIIGAANNLYPQYYDEISAQPIMPFLWPINIPLESIEFMWNMDTMGIWEAMPFDTIVINENGFLEFELSNSTGIDYVKLVISKTTGIAQSFFNLNPDGFMYYELKTQTLVDWSVGIGDIIYYKSNQEKLYDMKATISENYTVYANMTYLVEEYNSYGVPLVLPSGQPEYQFFSYLVADLEIWDPDTGSWTYVTSNIIAIANIYWPVSPLIFEIGGPPMLVPEGTTSSDLTDFFVMWSGVYDDITYTTGHVLLRNTTVSRELNYYFDETSGRMTMMHGWAKMPIPGEEWNYISTYPKFYQALASGANSFTMDTDFPTGVTVDVDVNTIGPGAGYIYNQFSMNPVNVSIPNGTASTYFDMLFVNDFLVSGNITLTIHVPLSIDLTRVLFFFYAFNMSGTEEWDSPPPDFYLNQVTYNFVQNTITINMEPWDRGVVSAMAFIDLDAEPPVEIPGYNLFFLSMMILIVSGLVIRKVRKK